MLDDFAGSWVAMVGDDVIASGPSPSFLLLELERTDDNAESMFRVPLDPSRGCFEGCI